MLVGAKLTPVYIPALVTRGEKPRAFATVRPSASVVPVTVCTPRFCLARRFNNSRRVALTALRQQAGVVETYNEKIMNPVHRVCLECETVRGLLLATFHLSLFRILNHRSRLLGFSLTVSLFTLSNARRSCRTLDQGFDHLKLTTFRFLHPRLQAHLLRLKQMAHNLSRFRGNKYRR